MDKNDFKQSALMIVTGIIAGLVINVVTPALLKGRDSPHIQLGAKLEWVSVPMEGTGQSGGKVWIEQIKTRSRRLYDSLNTCLAKTMRSRMLVAFDRSKCMPVIPTVRGP